GRDGYGAPYSLNERRSVPGNGNFNTMPRQIGPPSSEGDTAFRHKIWSKLLGAIDLDIDAASRVKAPAVRTQAAAAWQSLRRMSQHNERLRSYLDEIQDSKAEAVESHYIELKSDVSGDARGAEIVDKIKNDLDGMLNSLLLLPEVGVL